MVDRLTADSAARGTSSISIYFGADDGNRTHPRPKLAFSSQRNAYESPSNPFGGPRSARDVHSGAISNGGTGTEVSIYNYILK
jgi:hypothetical protein